MGNQTGKCAELPELRMSIIFLVSSCLNQLYNSAPLPVRLEAPLSQSVNYVVTRRKERFFLATKLWKDGVLLLPFVCHWCGVSNVSSQDRTRGKRLSAILGRDVFFCLLCSFFWIFKSTFQVCFVILVKFAQIFLFSLHLFLLSTNTC